jgi:hypothetical protein
MAATARLALLGVRRRSCGQLIALVLVAALAGAAIVTGLAAQRSATDLLDQAYQRAGRPDVRRPVLQSPVSSSTSTPWSWGRVAGSARSSSTRRWLTAWWSQVDSETNYCRPCTAVCWAPTMGSAPARAVMVLLRSRGSSRPCR